MGERRIFMKPSDERRATEVQLAILEELVLIRKELRLMQQQIQTAFDDLNTKVTNIESAEQAAETLLHTLNDALQNALNSSNDPTEVVNAVQAISDRLNTDAAALAAAVTANTPAASGNSSGSTSGSGTSGSDTSGSGTGTDTSGSSDTSGTSGSSGDAGAGSGDATDPTA